MKAKIWTIPADRMKAGTEHRVPLTDRAMDILRLMEKSKSCDLIFPGQTRGQPLSDMSLSAVLKRAKLGHYTVHGFRSTFRDWAGETTDYPRELVEAALAHTIGSKVERAYRRGDALERRRVLMAAWAGFLDRPPISAKAKPKPTA